MIKTTFFQGEDTVWLKGNVHAHSTFSDGKVEPMVLAKGYADKGYDFLAITDHDVFVNHTRFNNKKILLLPAMELTGPLTSDKNGHFGVIQKGELCDFEEGERFNLKTREETISFLEKHHENNLITLNHPYWSLLEWEEVIEVPHISCIEVYNYAAEMGEFVGEGTHFWNTMLRKGKSMWCIAADDSHNKGVSEPGWPFDSFTCDSFGGWIQVKAKEKSHKGIIDAIEAGSFYASTGPIIYDFYIDDGVFHVVCSPCQRIVVSGDWGYYQRKFGNGITEFSKPLKGKEKYLRVMCADEHGKVAYANPIYL